MGRFGSGYAHARALAQVGGTIRDLSAGPDGQIHHGGEKEHRREQHGVDHFFLRH